MALGDLLGAGGFNLGGIGGTIQVTIYALMAAFLIGGIFWYFWSKKQWNLQVEFMIPRQVQYLNPGELIDIENIKGSVGNEVGKGAYNIKKGAVFLKRKGKAKVAMKPFNVSKYLYNDNKLKVVQIGAEEYVPIAPQSFMLFEDDKTGEMCALLKLHTDHTTSKPWRNSFERESKQAFSILNFFREHQTIILIGLVIFLWGIQTMIIYQRIK